MQQRSQLHDRHWEDCRPRSSSSRRELWFRDGLWFPVHTYSRTLGVNFVPLFIQETFEFLNILQCHGFPKVMGVLTHLDLIKKVSVQRETKKLLKKRFWTEIYDGAKLFYLSGVLNGRYPDREINNLCRFLGVTKFRPLVFRNSHPYMLADRLEDMTPREQVRLDPKGDRTITLYGYLRGTNLRESTKVHIPGVGDLEIKSLKILADPCPLPTTESEKKRRLAEKHRTVHAPMSDLGGIMYDKDAVYINVEGNFTRTEGGDGKWPCLNKSVCRYTYLHS